MRPDAPLQRIGLSATQRPLDEIARLLGGYATSAARRAARRRRARSPSSTPPRRRCSRSPSRCPLPCPTASPARSTTPRPTRDARSIWPQVHVRLVERIRAARSTMIFVNSRRLAERLATALNETAGEEIALAHHGSVAKDTRRAIEERLKAGDLPADRRDLVARARHRHGRGRSGDPGRGAAVGRVRHPAHRAREPPRRRHSVRRARAEAQARPPRVRGGRRRHRERRRRGDLLRAQSARRPRPADRRHRGGRHPAARAPPKGKAKRHATATTEPEIETDVRGALGARPPRGAVRGAPAHELRGRARHARRSLPERRVRRSPPAHHVGPHARRRSRRARARSASRSRTQARSPIAGSTASSSQDGSEREGERSATRAAEEARALEPSRRRARRGDGLRAPRGRGLPPRRVVVARRADHARSRARHARPRACPARCRSGTAIAQAARSRSASASASSRARIAEPRRRPRRRDAREGAPPRRRARRTISSPTCRRR